MPINEAKTLPPGSEELKQEILERRELVRQMVGSLYPSIVNDEIVILFTRFNEISTPEMDHFRSPPDLKL